MSALRRPQAALGEAVLRGYPGCHAMVVKGPAGGVQVAVSSGEARVEAVVRKMEAWMGVRMREAARACVEVVQRGC